MKKSFHRFVTSFGALCTAASLFAHAAHGDDYPTAAEVDLATGQEVIGHNGLRYRVNREWSKADRAVAPVTNAHAMIEDS